MSMRICAIPDCKKKQEAGGFCLKHYARFKRHGDPLYESREYHGMSDSSEYRIWRSIQVRCNNKNQVNYYKYGKRGITVCERWLNSFSAFYEDMGPKPFPRAQIDRINNDGDYTPQNCHWVNNAQNCQNRSNNKLTMKTAELIRKVYKAGGILQRELAIIYGVSRELVSDVVTQRVWKN